MMLQGKRCLITGAGSGIGKATALLFAREGARVAVVDINEGKEKAVVDELVAEGCDARCVHADVSRSAEVAAAFEEMDRAWSGIDVLVNNAAFWTGDGTILDVSEEVWDRIHAVTLKGVWLCTREAVQRMRAPTGRGSIVNISSVNALVACSLSAYTAAKGGVIALTRLVAADYAADGVRCNCICPGTIATESTLAAWERAPARRDALLPLYPVGRFGTPEEVAQCALFLASDQSAFVTGAVLVADGGLTSSLARYVASRR